MDAGLRPIQVGDVSLIERRKDVTRCSHGAPRGVCLQDAGHGERCGQWPQDGAKATRWSRGSPGKEEKELPGGYLFYKDSCYPNCPHTHTHQEFYKPSYGVGVKMTTFFF